MGAAQGGVGDIQGEGMQAGEGRGEAREMAGMVVGQAEGVGSAGMVDAAGEKEATEARAEQGVGWVVTVAQGAETAVQAGRGAAVGGLRDHCRWR